MTETFMFPQWKPIPIPHVNNFYQFAEAYENNHIFGAQQPLIKLENQETLPSSREPILVSPRWKENVDEVESLPHNSLKFDIADEKRKLRAIIVPGKVREENGELTDSTIDKTFQAAATAVSTGADVLVLSGNKISEDSNSVPEKMAELVDLMGIPLLTDVVSDNIIDTAVSSKLLLSKLSNSNMEVVLFSPWATALSERNVFKKVFGDQLVKTEVLWGKIHAENVSTNLTTLPRARKHIDRAEKRLNLILEKNNISV